MKQEFDWVSLIADGGAQDRATFDLGELISLADSTYRKVGLSAASAGRRVPALHDPAVDPERSSGLTLGSMLFALLMLAEEALFEKAPDNGELNDRIEEQARVAMDTGAFGRCWTVEDAEMAWEMLGMFLDCMTETALSPRRGDFDIREEFALQCSDAVVVLLVVLMSEH